MESLLTVKIRLLATVAIFSVLCFSALIKLGQTASHHSGYYRPSKPILRPETDMHTAQINRIDVDRHQRFVVSASDDKTVRIWDLKTGNLLRTLRVTIGGGDLGKIYCVAISPDGDSVAVGGWTGAKSGLKFNIYIFNRESGRIRHVINDLPKTIKHLKYSPDGNYLVATLGGRMDGPNGIRVYETNIKQQIAEDRNYSDNSYWADFDASGRLVTTCWDGYIRLYDKDLRLIKKKQGPGGKQPFAAVFSPDGHNIAVGYYESPNVDVLSAENLELRFSADTRHVKEGDLSSVAWSIDGTYLYAAGTYRDYGKFPICRWSEGGQGSFSEFIVAENTVMDLKPLFNGQLAVAAQDPLIAVLSADGKPIWEHRGDIADFRAQQGEYGIRLSESGDVVKFGYEVWGRRQAQFSLKTWQLDLNPPADRMLSKPVTEITGLKVTDWLHTYSPRLNDKPIALYKKELSRCLAIAPDHKHFLLGAEWSLRLFDQTGNQLWIVDTPAITWAVNIASNGKRAVAGFSDGTLRWYRMSDGKELLSLFPHKDAKRWLVWTPKGFYNASEGGEKLIGYHLNKGADKAAEFVRVDQVGKIFYRPDLVAKMVTGGFDKVILSEVNRIGSIDEILSSGTPPKITLLSGKTAFKTNSRDFTLRFKLEDQGGGIGKIEYWINGVLIKTIGAARSSDYLGSRPSGVIEIDATGDDGINIFEAIVYNKEGDIASQPLKTIIEVDDPMKVPPSLYVLVVGISDYRDAALKIRFAHSDAEKMAKLLKQRGIGLFKEIYITSLLNKKATKNEIKKAFEGLSDAKPSDVFIWYLAGHGKAINGDYHFIPWEVLYENDEMLKAGSLSSTEISSLMEKIQARKSLLILDTCSSGLMTLRKPKEFFSSLTRGIEEKSSISRLMKFTGRIILAASTEHQHALEGHEGCGVFTYVLLRGLRGEADRSGEGQGVITIDELADYARKEVPKITLKKWRFRQIPMRNMHGDPFPIACKEGFDGPGCVKVNQLPSGVRTDG